MRGEVAVAVHMDIVDDWDRYSATVAEMADRAAVEAGGRLTSEPPIFRIQSGEQTVLVVFEAVK